MASWILRLTHFVRSAPISFLLHAVTKQSPLPMTILHQVFPLSFNFVRQSETSQIRENYQHSFLSKGKKKTLKGRINKQH